MVLSEVETHLKNEGMTERQPTNHNYARSYHVFDAARAVDIPSRGTSHARSSFLNLDLDPWAIDKSVAEMKSSFDRGVSHVLVHGQRAIHENNIHLVSLMVRAGRIDYRDPRGREMLPHIRASLEKGFPGSEIKDNAMERQTKENGGGHACALYSLINAKSFHVSAIGGQEPIVQTITQFDLVAARQRHAGAVLD